MLDTRYTAVCNHRHGVFAERSSEVEQKEQDGIEPSVVGYRCVCAAALTFRGRGNAMKTISLLAGMVFLAVGNVAGADEVSLTNLQQAVDFIATALESTNYVAIANACLDPRPKPEDYVLKDLQRAHNKTPLRKLYADKSFPTNDTTFKLGGHMAELWCTHIDFLKTNDVWRLKAIWMCK